MYDHVIRLSDLSITPTEILRSEIHKLRTRYTLKVIIVLQVKLKEGLILSSLTSQYVLLTMYCFRLWVLFS